MSEGLSIEMFKIWSDSQKELLESFKADLKAINTEQKETNNSIRDVVNLLKDDINTQKQIFSQHVIEYKNHVDSNDVRFKNLFQRQDTIDKILIERAPVWVVFKSFRKGLGIFVTAIIILLAAYFAVIMGFK